MAALHAMRRSQLAGMTFGVLHSYLSYACVLMGASFKLSTLYVLESASPSRVWLEGASVLACVLLTMVRRQRVLLLWLLLPRALLLWSQLKLWLVYRTTARALFPLHLHVVA